MAFAHLVAVIPAVYIVIVTPIPIKAAAVLGGLSVSVIYGDGGNDIS